MPSDHEARLRTCAEIIVRVGLNLQPGQKLLIAEPYELQGVSRDASGLVEAVSAAAREAGCPHPAVLWGDPQRLRQYAEQADWRGYTRLVADQASNMKQHLADGGAFLFPISSFPRLMQGVAAGHVSEMQRITWENFGPIIQRLTHGETQWSLVPAATPAWADAVFPELPTENRLGALHETVFAAMRIARLNPASARVQRTTDSPIRTWQTHLASLEQQRTELNARRHKFVRYQGPGTDLTVQLPAQHRWCTAQLTTKGGIVFVANLPTEEIFTAPDRNSAEGTVRVSRPVNYGGAVIEGIELEFKKGCVVQAQAHTGRDLLQRLLNTDDGACRLGEVALLGSAEVGSPFDPTLSAAISSPATWQNSGRLFYHTLLDENTSNHIALGEAYPFCNRSPFGFGLNRSLVHVDLPLDARVTLV